MIFPFMGVKIKSFSTFGDQKKHRKKCQKWSKIEVFLVLGPLKITCIKNEKSSLKIWEKTYKSMLGTFFDVAQKAFYGRLKNGSILQ